MTTMPPQARTVVLRSLPWDEPRRRLARHLCREFSFRLPPGSSELTIPHDSFRRILGPSWSGSVPDTLGSREWQEDVEVLVDSMMYGVSLSVQPSGSLTVRLKGSVR